MKGRIILDDLVDLYSHRRANLHGCLLLNGDIIDRRNRDSRLLG